MMEIFCENIPIIPVWKGPKYASGLLCFNISQRAPLYKYLEHVQRWLFRLWNFSENIFRKNFQEILVLSPYFCWFKGYYGHKEFSFIVQ